MDYFPEPSGYDGTGLDFLEPFKINKDTLIYLIKKPEHLTANNMRLIYRKGNIDASESKEDDQDVQVREEGGQDVQNTVQELANCNDVFDASEFKKL